ncbi:DUF4270 family protein [Dyadobacter crusticola]|uniref:DUF4270 family protein n=1 Tax=Dyadobacter crusticola TaxID=292407 RepID=UPI0004E15783|nr:DUF4270 family protein [Dyadobacter crusticola]
MKFKSGYLKGLFKASPLLFIFGMSASMIACEPTGDEIGALVQPNPDDFTVGFSDTARVQLSTVITDSVMTRSAGRMLVGRFTDPYFGKIQAASFFQPGINNGLTMGQEAVYDSLVLSMYYDNYTYGDTTKAMNLSVHKLQSDIRDKGVYFSTNSIPFDAAPLGTVKLAPRPFTSKRLVIRLSDVLGKDIFAKAKANLIPSNTEWINLLKGLVIKGAANDEGAVVGFRSDGATVNLYFHTPEVDGIRRDSTVIQNTNIFNQVLSDRTGTQIANLPVTRRVSYPTSQTGNTAFIQAGTGIMTRIDLPTVRDLRFQKYIAANRAFLRITPKRLSVTNQFKAPPALYVYRVDRNNDFYVQPFGPSQIQLPVPLYSLTTASVTPVPIAALYVDDLVTNKQYYLLDISSYVTDLLTSESGDVGALVLRTSQFNPDAGSTYPAANTDFTNTFNRLVFGDQQSDDPGVKLELYYTRITP